MKLEVFFDYACPYCYKGYDIILKLMPDYPQLQVEWIPCEAHPRPDRYGPHSDLCARGMYFTQAQGADVYDYHRIIFDGIYINKKNVEDLNVLTGIVQGTLDQVRFRASMLDGEYKNRLAENNSLAWEKHRFEAVPSICMNGRTLGSIEDIGLSEHMIRKFIKESSEM